MLDQSLPVPALSVNNLSMAYPKSEVLIPFWIEALKWQKYIVLSNAEKKKKDEKTPVLRGAWRDRDTNDILLTAPLFLLSWLQIFQLCLSFWTSSFDLVLF